MGLGCGVDRFDNALWNGGCGQLDGGSCVANLVWAKGRHHQETIVLASIEVVVHANRGEKWFGRGWESVGQWALFCDEGVG